jgi:hypothetical protein
MGWPLAKGKTAGYGITIGLSYESTFMVNQVNKDGDVFA